MGTPDEVVEQITEIAEREFDHFVFDLRMQHDRFEETLAGLPSTAGRHSAV